MPDYIRSVLLLVPLTVLVVAGCSAPGEPGGDSGGCDAIPSGEGRVVIGFWDTPACSGDPLTTNSFPVESDADCYCWPGNSGQNSVMNFSCNGGDGSFTCDQYTTPRIVDYAACLASR